MGCTDLVSVLVPCYNAEDYVATAIESAINQTYPHIEVLVLDDGSTDGSRDVLERFANSDKVSCTYGPNRGGNAARNRLTHMARGKYVQFLDADDFLDPRKIELQVDQLKAGYDVVFTAYTRVWPDQQEVIEFPYVKDRIDRYFINNSVITMLPLHHRKDLLLVGGFDESLRCCQEYELHFRLARQVWRNVAYLNVPTCSHRQVAGSVSSDDSQIYKTRASLLSSWAQLCESGENSDDELKSDIAKLLHNCGRHLIRVGEHQKGGEAFDEAKRLSRNAHSYSHWILFAVSRLIGPGRLEKLLGLVKNRTNG